LVIVTPLDKCVQRNDAAELSQLEKHLCSHFLTKDLGCQKYVLAIKLPKCTVNSQMKYAPCILKGKDVIDCRSINNIVKDPNEKEMKIKENLQKI